MKKILTLLAATAITLNIFGQAPEAMSYQAVIRDNSNALVKSTTVGMRISILTGSVGGASVYTETQTPLTNANGLATIQIGTGTVVSGVFSAINWGGGLYFIKTETDISGGTSYSISGTTQLLSVPYALYAKTSGSSGTAGGTADFADFYALMPSDNAVILGAGADIDFPQNGPSGGTNVTRTSTSAVNLAKVGTYSVTFQVSINEPTQLVLTLNGTELAYTTVGRATGTTQLTGTCLIQTSVVNSTLTVRHPAASSNAVTITNMAGGPGPVSAHLVIMQVK